jgi:hypothetical protein
MRLLSGFKFTFIVLILLPTIVVITHFLVTAVVIDYFRSISTLATVQQNFQHAKLAVDIFSFFEIIVFIVMIVIYPPYPAPYSAEKYFMERGYEAAVTEFNLVKKILYVSVPLLIFFTVINLLQPFLENFFPARQFISPITESIVFYSARGFLFLAVLAGILKMVFALARKRFRLYYAKGCMALVKKSNDEVEKMGFLIMGLNSYNSYLRRYMNLQIKDIKKIYSKLATLSDQEKDASIAKIIGSFDSGDTLEPLRYLTQFKDPESDVFLVEEPIFDKIKTQVTYAIGVIPVVLTIIERVFAFRG